MLSETGPSTSSAEQSHSDDVDTRSVKLVGEGKRHLLVGDAPTAVTSLQEACEILAEKYGEVSDQCADPYYYYGNALLELGRMETGVLGNALDGVPDGAATDTEDENEHPNIESVNKLKGNERKKVVEQVKDALEATYKLSQKILGEGEGAQVNGDAKVGGEVKVSGEAKVNGEAQKTEKKKEKKDGNDKKLKEGKSQDGEKKVTTEEKKKEDASSEEKKEVKDVGADTTDMGEVAEGNSATEEESDDETGNETAEENPEVNPDDIPNFQLAWEMLELSRVIFSRKAKEYMLKVAQVHFKLGELGLETDQYSQSLDDFSKCLEIQKVHLEPESRLIAGSHYNLGLAYTLDTKMEKALQHFTQAKTKIEERRAKLEKDTLTLEEEKDDGYEEAVTKIKTEIKELNELIPDLLSKIEDAKESQKKSAAVGETSSSFDQPSSSAGSSTAAPIQTVQIKAKTTTNISHLVKRKRTEAGDNSGTAQLADTKRTKQDGEATHNGCDKAKDEKKEAAMETA